MSHYQLPFSFVPFQRPRPSLPCPPRQPFHNKPKVTQRSTRPSPSSSQAAPAQQPLDSMCRPGIASLCYPIKRGIQRRPNALLQGSLNVPVLPICVPIHLFQDLLCPFRSPTQTPMKAQTEDEKLLMKSRVPLKMIRNE